LTKALGAVLPGGLGGLFSAAGSGAAAAAPSTGRAMGGYGSPNRPIVVGERGPEIFTPAAPGHVTPNGQAPQQEAPSMDVAVINVATMEAALSALGSQEGRRIIVNEIRNYRGKS